MPTYLTPGVYIEELPSSSRPIEAVGTSTAVFIGFTREGPLGEPRLMTKWDDYAAEYGGIPERHPADAMGQSVAAFYLNGGSRAYVVRLAAAATSASGYLLHPDTPDRDHPQPADQLVRFSAANPGGWGNDVTVELTPQGTSGRYRVQVLRDRAPAPGLDPVPVPVESFADLSLDSGDPRYLMPMLATLSSVVRARLEGAEAFMFGSSESEALPTAFDPTTLNGKSMAVAVNGTGRPVTFGPSQFVAGDGLPAIASAIQTLVRGSVSTNPAVRDFTAAAVGRVLRLRSGVAAANSSVVVSSAASNDAAVLVHLSAPHGGQERTGAEALAGVLNDAEPADTSVALAGGTDGTAPTSADPYKAVFAALLKVRDINMVCLPGRTWTPGDAGALDRGIIDAALSHARTAQRRMVIIDPPAGTELETDGQVSDLGLPTSPNAAFYYPWLHVANPAYSPETNPTAPATVAVPPCGFAAGMWASIDARRGVWKAPAGTEAGLLGVARLDQIVEDAEQEALNPAGVNAIRRFPGYGTVIWGSRTLATRADPQWRYVPIRRTAMLIEGSVFNGIQWAVFEPNDDLLWAALRTNISAFMDGLFRAGAFQGSQASKAYFVACGLGSTMTQDDIDRGQVIVQVGFAPLKPAEFVIVRIQQQVGQK